MCFGCDDVVTILIVCPTSEMEWSWRTGKRGRNYGEMIVITEIETS